MPHICALVGDADADIPWINLTPTWYNPLTPAIVYVTNDVKIPVNAMTPQINDIATKRTSLRAHVNGTGIVLKSTNRGCNITLFLHAQGINYGYLTMFISKVIR